MEFETIIGLEVHAQLMTKSKMYCRCSADYSSDTPNTHVCPVCMGMPGTLPTINKQAVEFGMMTALALNCSVSEYTKFDRKNYPYPDLMKGYQISQFDHPVGVKGWMEIEAGGQKRKVGVTRVHLEEDVAKLSHHPDENGESFSHVDVNRAGMPLMEIVGEPDLRSPEEAREYLVKLRSILQYLGVSTANMEEGSFRCDANISIRPVGTTEYLSKVEVKNMNSFKAVYKALEYEAERQRKAFTKGEKIPQETRGWVEESGKTVSQRSKEYAHDYRYFPEPDLPPLSISADWVEQVRKKLPELPEARRDRFMSQYGLPLYDANLLTVSKSMAEYFEKAVKVNKNIQPKEIANWLLGPASGIINAESADIEEFGRRVSCECLVRLLEVNAAGTVSTASAKAVLEEMYKSGRDADAIIKEQGLGQINDSSEIEKSAAEIIAANPQAVADYRAGKEQSLKFLVGQMMRATRGRTNPNMAAELLKKKLEEG
jgi:aspartyl-tRNA(Asn)/glutamyl-tRNA(Gln) amidotransferase subunit B